MEIKKRNEWGHDTTCQKCKSELRLSTKDISVHGVGLVDQGEWVPHTFHWTCVVCKQDHQIQESLLPSGLVIKLESNARRRR